MERRSKSLSTTLSAVRLYRDDIQDLFDLFAAESEGDITLVTDDHTLTSPSELEQYEGRVLRDVEVKSRDPYVSVHLRAHGGAWLYAAADDARSVGVFEKARQIVAARRRWFHPLVSHDSLVWGGAVVLGSAGLAFLRYGGPIAVIGGVAFAVAAAWLGVAYYFQFNAGAVVVPLRRSERPSFFARNRDHLFVATFAATIGAVIAYLLTRL